MTSRPRHPKSDANQAEIVQQLRDLGFIVHDVSSLGGDCLDLFVGGRHQFANVFLWLQVEIKMPDGELTAEEREYIDHLVEPYGRCNAPVTVARRVEDILYWFGRIE